MISKKHIFLKSLRQNTCLIEKRREYVRISRKWKKKKGVQMHPLEKSPCILCPYGGRCIEDSYIYKCTKLEEWIFLEFGLLKKKGRKSKI